MRLRNVSGAKEIIASDKYVVKEPEKYKGKWNELFDNNNPIHVEIGMGKGKFIIELAEKNPNINYIGIEKYSSVLVRAVQKINEKELSNLYFIRFNAELLETIFDKNEISRIYLNFSDPWPKDRHAKRRLTSKNYLDKYDNCLRADGNIIFKTDNRKLFDFSIEEIKDTKWKLKNITYDLHNSEYVDDNVMTEYEEKFVQMGMPICRMVIYR
ncbi:MAG: tRNA (guanosine(46)-N7)-methyltransferase TrmB [Clostridiales bacterium]|nr:tRNA (guanosine(46)-N7)-methyltransferase TrmB [Clostridiales bacterium]